MKLFDKLEKDETSNEEIEISADTSSANREAEKETRLGKQVEKDLISSETSGRETEKQSIKLEDIFEQNKEIISLLKDINSEEENDESQVEGGGLNGVL